MTEQNCVFSMSLVKDYGCHECNDYKGLMSLKEAKPYLGEDCPEEDEELLYV